MKITSDFSLRLSEIMADRGLTQGALAELVGVAQGTVSGWLNGAVPLRRTADVLCEKLRVSPDWLIYGVGDARRKGVTGSEKARLGIVQPVVLSQKKSLKFLAGNLKAIRGPMSLREFAETVGVSTPAVYERYEKGRVPRPAILQRMANRIGITVAELLAPVSADRLREIQADMARVSKESVFPKRRLPPWTRLVLMQARREFVTPETQKLISELFDLKNLAPDALGKLYRHLESTTFNAPLEIGRYYYPFLDAVGAEINRRSENRK